MPSVGAKHVSKLQVPLPAAQYSLAPPPWRPPVRRRHIGRNPRTGLRRQPLCVVPPGRPHTDAFCDRPVHIVLVAVVPYTGASPVTGHRGTDAPYRSRMGTTDVVFLYDTHLTRQRWAELSQVATRRRRRPTRHTVLTVRAPWLPVTRRRCRPARTRR